MSRWKWLSVFFVFLFLCGTSFARVVNFRAGVSSTEVNTAKGGKVYVVVELLNDEGQIDPAGYQEVQDLKVQVSSVLGNVADANHIVDADDKGVVLIPVSYNPGTAGTDLITVTVKETYYAPEGSAAETYTRVLGTKRFNVNLTVPQNTAKSIKVESVAISDSPVEDEVGKFENGVCNNVNATGGCVVEAGRAFSLTLYACTQGVNDNNSDCTIDANQNSEVTVWLVPDKKTLVEGNKASETYTFTGTFEHGVAKIDIPADTVTKAGRYYIYASAPSVNLNPLTGNYEATEKFNLTTGKSIYTLDVSPRAAVKVKVKATDPVSDLDMDGKFWCWRGADGKDDKLSSNLTFYLADEYGNIADNTTGLENDPRVYFSIKYGSDYIDTIDWSPKTKGVTYTTVLKCSGASFTLSDNGTRSSEIFNISVIDDGGFEFDTTSLEVDVYASYLGFNGTVDTDNTATAALGWFNNTSYWDQAGLGNNQTFYDVFSEGGLVNGTVVQAEYNDTKADGVKDLFEDIFGTNGGTLVFKFYDETNNEVASVNVEVNTGANYTEIGTRRIILQDYSKVIDRVCVFYKDDTNHKYLPPYCLSNLNMDLRDKAFYTQDIKVWRVKSKRCIPDVSGRCSAEEVSSISLAGSAPLSVQFKLLNSTSAAEVYGNLTSLAENDTVWVLLAAGVDSYGNINTEKDVYVGAKYDNSTNDTQTGNVTLYWEDTRVTSDNITLKAGSATKVIPVSISWTPGLDHVDFVAPFDYMLTVSKMPVTVMLKKADGSAYTDDVEGLKLYISDPALVRVQWYNGTAWVDKNVGDEIGFTGGVANLLIKTLAATGDVTISIKNDAGTVSGELPLHIVNSVSEIPVTVGNLVVNPATVEMQETQTRVVTVKVVDPVGNAIGNVEVEATSGNSSVVTVSEATCTSDDSGECEFTLAAVGPGSATVTFTAGGVNATVSVMVEAVETSNAAPEQPVETVYTLENANLETPAATVTLSGDQKKAVVLKPQVAVPEDYKGKEAKLYWAICANDYSWCTNVNELGTETLGDTVTFNILSQPVDLSGVTGTYKVFVGFATQDDMSDLVFTFFDVTLE